MTPMKRKDYPANWAEISARIRWERAGGRCEGSPAFPDCRAKNYEPHPDTGSQVVLTVAHMDHDKTNNSDENLRALCQRCHLAHDREEHTVKASRTRRKKIERAGQARLLPEGD